MFLLSAGTDMNNDSKTIRDINYLLNFPRDEMFPEPIEIKIVIFQ
jgi:hypothetical protein